MKQQSKRRPAPKQLRAIQTSRHLHVAKHRHTGHILPRRNTSYAALVMIVLCIGVLMASWSAYVTADQSYVVHASVIGPPPTQAATIDSPEDGAHLTSTPVTVSGSCPQNTYVSLLRNGFSSGVALCSAAGTYQIATDLFRGTDQLVARDYSFNDQPGPDSSTVTIQYLPPVTSGKSSQSNAASYYSTTPYSPTSSNSGLPEPLLLKPNFTFVGYYVGQAASWQVDIEGGSAPYAVDVSWGDGSHTLYSRAVAGVLTILHTYAKTGGYHGSYVVDVTSTDAAGNQTFLQLLAIITSEPKTVSTVLGGSGQGGTSGGLNLLGDTNLGRMVDYAWSSYGVVVLMLFSFWLGERRELHFLKPRHKRPHHA